MNLETKLWIIIIIVVLITFRTFIDIFYSTHYHFYNNDSKKSDKIYDNYMFTKSFLDVPIVILSIFLLFNIHFNVKIYLFLFFSMFNIFIDHFLEYLNIEVSDNVAYLIERYYSLVSDVIMFTIGIYIIYKIFYVTN